MSDKQGVEHPKMIEGRWKPGQSGNPSGKPRGSKNFKTIIKELLAHEVQNPVQSIFYKDRTTISAAELLILRLYKKAVEAGDVNAAREIMDRAEAPVVQRIEHSSIDKDDREQLDEWKRQTGNPEQEERESKESIDEDESDDN